MTKLGLATLLLVGAASVQAQPQQSAVAVQPSVDSVEQRQALRKLSACLAEARPRWARQTLAHGYLSDAQATTAAQSLSGRDTCVMKDDVEVTFRTSSMVASLAEHFLRAELDRANSTRLAQALVTLRPMNVSEDFALCIASRNPAAARALAFSEPGSVAETRAAHEVAVNVRPCTNQSEQLTVDLQSLRALVSIALYRGMTTVLATTSQARAR